MCMRAFVCVCVCECVCVCVYVCVGVFMMHVWSPLGIISVLYTVYISCIWLCARACVHVCLKRLQKRSHITHTYIYHNHICSDPLGVKKKKRRQPTRTCIDRSTKMSARVHACQTESDDDVRTHMHTCT